MYKSKTTMDEAKRLELRIMLTLEKLKLTKLRHEDQGYSWAMLVFSGVRNRRTIQVVNSALDAKPSFFSWPQ